jgi:prolyl-tRNA synthetase
LRHLLSGQVLPSGPLDGNRQLSPLLDSFRSEALGGDERSQVAFADWGRRDGTARSLKDTSGLGVLEWAAISSNAEQGRAALSEVEGRLVEVLGKCGLAVQLGEGGRDRTLWSYPETACGTPFLRCGDCGYLAEASTARFALPASVTGSPEPMRSVPTPGAKTIRLLCEQLGVTPASTLKALFLTTAQGETVLAVIRGDLDASLDKLGLEIGTEGLRPSTSEEVTRLGVVAGYAGPVGLPVRPDRRGEGVWVVADRSIVESVNLVAGANQEGVHITGVNYPRDFRVTETFDFARAPRHASCTVCGGALVEERGLVLAQKRVSDVEAWVNKPTGQVLQGVLSSLQLFPGAVTVGVLAAAIRETGIRFPPACAPFAVHVIELSGGLDTTPALKALNDRGFDVLIDDRDVSAGVKFAEAEWIGSPIQIVAGRKSSEAGGVEVRSPSGLKSIVDPEDIVPVVEASLGQSYVNKP